MRIRLTLVLLGSIAITLLAAGGPGHAAEPPINIIFDTDMGPDCDDVGALLDRKSVV